MSEILTLDELVNVKDDLSHIYGKKAVGLSQLKRFANSVMDSDRHPFPLNIPDYFAVPKGYSPYSDGFLRAYESLTKNLDSRKIILARSSSPGEKPGEFETFPSLYNPGDFNSSLTNILVAASRVIESGSDGFLVQLVESDEKDFIYDFERDSYPLKKSSIKCFGSDGTSFYGNSHNPFNSSSSGNNASVILARGFGGKIARGDEDVIFAFDVEGEPYAINMIHKYEYFSGAPYSPLSVEVVLSDNPSDFHIQKFRKEPEVLYNKNTTVIGRTDIPINMDWCFSSKHHRSFSAKYLLDLVHDIKDYLGHEVEIEGYINKDAINLLQVRKYDLPTNYFNSLSNIPDNKIILKTRNEPLDVFKFKSEGSFGYNQLLGDLVISDKILNVQEDDIFMYVGTEHHKNIEPFENYKKLILMAFQRGPGGKYLGQHTLGKTLQELVDLEKKGVRSLALSPTYHNLFDNPKKYFGERFSKIGNNAIYVPKVGVECANSEAQIYFTD